MCIIKEYYFIRWLRIDNLFNNHFNMNYIDNETVMYWCKKNINEGLYFFKRDKLRVVLTPLHTSRLLQIDHNVILQTRV